jgi:hypothetical protein
MSKWRRGDVGGTGEHKVYTCVHKAQLLWSFNATHISNIADNSTRIETLLAFQPFDTKNNKYVYVT